MLSIQDNGRARSLENQHSTNKVRLLNPDTLEFLHLSGHGTTKDVKQSWLGHRYQAETLRRQAVNHGLKRRGRILDAHLVPQLYNKFGAGRFGGAQLIPLQCTAVPELISGWVNVIDGTACGGFHKTKDLARERAGYDARQAYMVERVKK